MAYDPEAALAAARAEPPDAVLFALGPPHGDGFRAAAGLRRRPAARPAAFIAVTDFPELADRARAAGFAGALVRPLDYAGLERLLGDLLAVRRLLVRARGPAAEKSKG